MFLSRPFVSPRYPRSGKHDDDDGADDDGSCADAQSPSCRQQWGKKMVLSSLSARTPHNTLKYIYIYIYRFTFSLANTMGGGGVQVRSRPIRHSG